MTLVLFHPSHPIPSLPAAAFCNLQVGLASASLSVPILSVLLVFSLLCSALLPQPSQSSPSRITTRLHLSLYPSVSLSQSTSILYYSRDLIVSFAARLRRRRETQCARLSKACNKHYAHHTAELFIQTTRDDTNRQTSPPAMDRHLPSHPGERPPQHLHHASTTASYPPPYHMPTAQPPTQIPFADPFSHGRDPFIPNSHARKSSMGPTSLGWPPAQGTFQAARASLHKRQMGGARRKVRTGGANWGYTRPRQGRVELRANLQVLRHCGRTFAATSTARQGKAWQASCSYGTTRRLDSGT